MIDGREIRCLYIFPVGDQLIKVKVVWIEAVISLQRVLWGNAFFLFLYIILLMLPNWAVTDRLCWGSE
jgi:hypothetical protein